MRYVPIEFPCGCRCRGGVPDFGAGVLVTENCGEHSEAHRSDTAVVIDESSIAGCSCPGCEFGRYATERGPVENAVADNWRFLARLNAARRRG